MILVLEGIHALNPELTPDIPEANKFRVYVSALTSILIDHHNLYSNDRQTVCFAALFVITNIIGCCSAEVTISRWPSVRTGEEKWIFLIRKMQMPCLIPLFCMNWQLLKTYVEPLLRQVPQSSPEYSEAYRLIKFLQYFIPVHDKELPPTSLLREFLGGSSFRY